MVTLFDRETHADIGAKKSSALTVMKNSNWLCIYRIYGLRLTSVRTVLKEWFPGS